jgi:uncharacterized membrane protein
MKLPFRRSLDLSRPRGTPTLGVHYDPESFGRLSETIARYLGTARYLVFQTVVIIVWITINVVPELRFDEYPFILLTLALSMQASYAAPLILLAQNRQADRDRAQAERDRDVVARTQADTEYLARELASLRLAISGLPTADDLTDALEKVNRSIARLSETRTPADSG